MNKIIEFEDLKKPFDASSVSWRVGSTNKKKWERNGKKGDKKGIALAYIDARDVQDRLDEVCGVENWQVRYPWHDAGKLNCEIGIRINNEWVWKGCGAGDTAVEGDKGAFSDAFKRAAVRWGIGRYLYDLPNTWVDLNDFWSMDKQIINGLKDRLEKWQIAKFKKGGNK